MKPCRGFDPGSNPGRGVKYFGVQMKSIHVVNEEYAHYRKRKNREAISFVKWVLPALLILFGYFLYSVAIVSRPGDISMPIFLMLTGFVGYGFSFYLTFFKK